MHRFSRLLFVVLCWALWVGNVSAAPNPANAPAQAPKVAPAAPSDGKVPVLQMEETTFDAGEVMEGAVVSHDFKVKNTGVAVLEITQVRPG